MSEFVMTYSMQYDKPFEAADLAHAEKIAKAEMIASPHLVKLLSVKTAELWEKDNLSSSNSLLNPPPKRAA